MGTSLLFSCSACFILLVASLVPSVVAAETSTEGNSIHVEIRMIRASDKIVSSDDGSDYSRIIDRELRELGPKLSSLPFKSFQLVSERSEELVLRCKEVIHLPNGQTLSFRPMYANHERIGLWLTWREQGGEDILNTRIHFDADESILTGTDETDSTGLILAIKANQSSSH